MERAITLLEEKIQIPCWDFVHIKREWHPVVLAEVSVCVRRERQRLQEALGFLWLIVGKKIKLGGVWGAFFFGVWVSVPAPWWQWRLGDGFAQCLRAEVDAPLKTSSAESTSSAGCHKLLTLADVLWLFNILVAKTGNFYECPDSTRAISPRNRPPWALFLEHHINSQLNKVRYSCVQRFTGPCFGMLVK